MERFRSLRQNIVQELTQRWKQPSEGAGRYLSHTWHLPPIELPSLIPRLPLKVIGFWRSPDQNKDILALMPLKFYGNTGCFKQMTNILEENPRITFFGGQYFTPSSAPPSYEWAGFGSYHYFLPGLCLETSPKETTVTLAWPREIVKNSAKQADYIFQVKQALTLPPTPSPPPLSGKPPVSICSLERWKETIDSALEHIRLEKFQKVVVSRKQIIDLKGYVSPRNIFEKVHHQTSDNSYRYYLQSSPDTAFISTTPEKLFELNGDSIKTDALAGTRPRGKNRQEDKQLEEELLQDPKERHEHELVVSFLKSRLEELNVDITIHPLRILKLPHVQHLWTPVEGSISTPVDCVEKIINQLHPSPAVGGCPTDAALKFLADHEPFQRGLYAAPIGIVQKGYAHFAVAIRSTLIYHNKMHIYGGAGIVKGSRGNKEWKETQNKMMAFQEIF